MGKIFRIDQPPVNAQIQAFYNVATPDDDANWQIRAQVRLMFPK